MRAIPIPALLALVPLTLCVPGSAAFADSWAPVSPADLALKQGRVEADADAEVLEWEIQVTDEWSGDDVKSTQTQRQRIKIFNERGRDAYTRIDIPYLKGSQVGDVAARTIRPDGTVLAVKKDAILDRTVLKAGGVKVQNKSIAMPGVEPGCIVEYRWSISHYDRLSHNVLIPLQLDIPVETIRLLVHPLPVPLPAFQMRMRAFNFAMPPLTEDDRNTNVMTITSMPSFQKEPYAPPDLGKRAWLVIYYTTVDEEYPVSNYWRKFGRSLYEITGPLSRASGDVKKVTKSVLKDAQDPNAAIDTLLDYCRKTIRNSDRSDSGLTVDQRAWLQKEHSASEHLKAGLADSYGVLKVFLAMATAAGLDARLAYAPDRSQCLFTSSSPTPYLLTRQCAVVNALGRWRAVDPSAADLPPDMLPWELQGVDMLIPDPTEPQFLRSPVGTPEQSLERRTASLKLSPDGTVEGEITDEMTGQSAATWRAHLRDHSAVDKEKKVIDSAKANLSAAEVTDIRFDPGSDPSGPFRITYHVRVPAYAQRTSQRLFLQPAFFQRGETQTFTAAKRESPIFFDYAWSETDMVTIELPPGFHLESTPPSTPILLPGVGRHSAQIRHTEDGRQIQFLHSILFGENGTIAFPAEEYPKLKKAFEDFRTQDQTVLSIAADETLPR